MNRACAAAQADARRRPSCRGVAVAVMQSPRRAAIITAGGGQTMRMLILSSRMRSRQVHPGGLKAGCIEAPSTQATPATARQSIRKPSAPTGPALRRRDRAPSLTVNIGERYAPRSLKVSATGSANKHCFAVARRPPRIAARWTSDSGSFAASSRGLGLCQRSLCPRQKKQIQEEKRANSKSLLQTGRAKPAGGQTAEWRQNEPRQGNRTTP